ncbi:methyltransferase family protein [Actinospica robiniae]|uniref:methyltransferase family protein n=1 Tax=Actinospica robiniae TaxID=304901 RepID=UPI0003FAAC34|nr:isoprenylcysteine carboxylmethyltransferase family protein [Actinospica robiniae]
MKGPVAQIILVGWAVFWIGWLLAAANVKRGQVSWNRYAGIRLVLVVIVVAVVRARHGVDDATLKGAVPKGIGLALWALGLGLAVWARVYIGRNWGTPMSRKEDPELVTTGPYRRVRHPIYSGIVLAMIGTAVAISLYWLIVAALFGVYFAYSARAEERYMTEQFPEAYPAYQRSSKMLIPFIF